MATSTEDNPVTRRLNQFIYVSMGLSFGILACSMIFLGVTSFWLSEAGFVLTIIHHAIILHDRSKRRKIRPSGTAARPSTLPASSTKFSIFAAWFIVPVWMVALAFVIMFTIYAYGGWSEGWDNRYIAMPFELSFLVLETSLMVMIALWCMRERRFLFGVAGNAKWYRLP